ncbi:hypothetical protein BDV93DRAFT_610613 [Ceratobasidium sp. AG-I]|nr:hypothetical protein BDV93DRAFT_610613 [Ceratobasidium sp. AG-I]
MIGTIYAKTIYAETFRQWKAFHDHFIQSLQQYVNACTSLELALSQSPRSASDKIDLEAALLQINAQVSLASTYDKQLQKAWGCLSRIRNHSIKLVPINLLPPEILSDIFVLANPTRDVCVGHLLPANKPPKPTCLDAILSVCAYWRRQAFDTPLLWSHVDLVVAGTWRYKFQARAESRIEHSGNTPLEFHILGVDRDFSSKIKTDDIFELVEFVAPHTPQLQSLIVNLQFENRDIMRSVLRRLVFQSQHSSRLQSLSLSSSSYTVAPGSSLGALPLSDGNSYISWLGSIRILKLYSMHIDWSSSAYRGLVELEIDELAEQACPSTAQMGAVLSACPKLRRLRLSRMTIHPPSDPGITKPAFLGELEELHLLYLRRGLSCLLALITPGPRLSQASVKLDGSAGENEAVYSFFNFSHVTMLYVADFRDRRKLCVSQTLGTLLELKYLTLESSNLAIDPGTVVTNSWPQLHTLYVIGSCLPSISSIVGAIQNIHTLSFWGCFMVSRKPNGQPETMPELASSLIDVPQFEYSSQRSSCPASRWPCVQRLSADNVY